MIVFLVCVVSLLVSDRHVLGVKMAKRQSDVPSPSERTVVVLQFDNADPETVFLLGGLSNHSNTKCSDSAPPCSIPIYHVPSFATTEDYSNWKTGDRFLDWNGAESGQGLSDGQTAKGTPTVKMGGTDALNLANSDYLWDERLQAVFWVVELQMDCSQSGGLFEIQAVTTPEDQTMGKNIKQHQFRDRGFDPHRFAGVLSHFPDTNSRLSRDPEGRFAIPGLEKWFSEKARESIDFVRRDNRKILLSRPKPMRIRASGVSKRAATGASSRARHRKRMEQFPCSGDVHFRAPYQPDVNTYVGLCGYGNIFRYGTHICEINELTPRN